MSRRLRLAPLCFALLALAWVQVFGLVRGYVCDCGGQETITVADHCHGPHGAACHEQPVSHHEETDPPAGGTTEHHNLLKETVVAQQKLQNLTAPLPAVMLIAEQPNWTLPALALNSLYTHGAGHQKPRADHGRSWPQVLARTIVMRI